MLTGTKLISDIDQFSPSPGKVALWWAGQQGFILKWPRTVVYLDVFFSPGDRRLIPPLLDPGEVHNADVVLGTHDHRDHIDRDAWVVLAEASPQAVFVVPELLRVSLAKDLKIPAERFIGLDDGKSVQVGDLTITGVSSAHEFLDRDEETGLHPYLGFVIESNGFCMYHSGDTCLYEGLLTKLRRWSFDVVMLPINGRDAKRLAAGCIGNMTYQEAVDLAGALQVGLAIPAHYDMFEGNSEDPNLFLDYMKVKYPHIKAAICKHGERMVLGAPAK